MTRCGLKKYLARLMAMSLAALFLNGHGVALAESSRVCIVVGVTDGDTLTARCGEPGAYEQVKVRLAGIDAPERKQAYGQKAREALSDLAFDRWARLECVKNDRYGRSVRKVMVMPPPGGGAAPELDAGLAMIKMGMAWWYRKYSRDQRLRDRQLYEAAECDARRLRAGLWWDTKPVPPWAWRRPTAAEPSSSLADVGSCN